MSKREFLKNTLFAILIPILLQAGWTLAESIRTGRSLQDIAKTPEYVIFGVSFIVAYVVLFWLVTRKTGDNDKQLREDIRELIGEIKLDREQREQGRKWHGEHFNSVL